MPLPASTKKMLYYRDVLQDIIDELWRRFELALKPFAINGKLTAVHFQLAPWVVNEVRFDDAHRWRTLEFQRELA